jgi:hypothetical protein
MCVGGGGAAAAAAAVAIDLSEARLISPAEEEGLVESPASAHVVLFVPESLMSFIASEAETLCIVVVELQGKTAQNVTPLILVS